jgi:hypothetical protein
LFFSFYSLNFFYVYFRSNYLNMTLPKIFFSWFLLKTQNPKAISKCYTKNSHKLQKQLKQEANTTKKCRENYRKHKQKSITQNFS